MSEYLDFLIDIKNSDVIGQRIYKEVVLPIDDIYMLTCDWHIPYHSDLWADRVVAIARHYNIKRHIIIGDLFDCEFASHWQKNTTFSLDEEGRQCRKTAEKLVMFEQNILIQGNHENRITRLTKGIIQAKHLFHILGGDLFMQKFQYTEFDKLRIGDKWLLVHPASYSQLPCAVAKKLCAIYHCNVINTHGHNVGRMKDVSGKYEAIDLGGLIERNKVPYVNEKTTTHPMWNKGFGMLRRGHFTHFTAETDWSLYGTT